MKIRSILLGIFFLIFCSSAGLAETTYTPVPVPGMEKGCCALAIQGNYLYAANNGQLCVYDIHDPAVPRKCGEMAVRGARQIVVSGNYLYLSARHWGVHIVDISEPSAPRLVKWLDTAELATGMEVSDGLLFVTLRVYGVQLFDISNPLQPRALSLLRTGEAQSTHFFDGKLAIGDWGSARLTIADITDPRKPKILGSAQLDGFGDGVWVSGNLCYAATGHHARHGAEEKRYGRGHGLEIFDISAPSSPRRLGGIKFPPFYEIGNDFWMVRSDGKTAFVGDTHNGFFDVDVSSPVSPRLLGRAILPEKERYSAVARKKVVTPDCVADLAVGDGIVYLAGQKTGLFTISIGERARRLSRKSEKLVVSPSGNETVPYGLTRYPVANVVRRLAVRGDELFAACSETGVKRFRISVDGSLAEIETLSDGRAYDVAVASENILLVARGISLDTYRIKSHGFQKLGSFKGSFHRPIQVIHPLGNLVVCSGGTSWLQAVDISNPTRPRMAGKDSAGSLLYSDAIPEKAIQNVFPVSWHGRGIYWYSIQSGEMVRHSFPSPAWKISQLFGITSIGNWFVAPCNKGYLLMNPKNGTSEMIPVQGIRPTGIPSWDGRNIVVFSDRRNGMVRAFDFREPRHARMIPERCYDLSSGIPDRVVFHRGRMLVPGWNLGILVEKGNF